jgi:hypothetical protein
MAQLFGDDAAFLKEQSEEKYKPTLGRRILLTLQGLGSQLSGEDRPPTGMDVVRANQPYAEGGGFWNTINNLNRQMSQGRVAGEQLDVQRAKEAREQELKSAQADYYGAGVQQRLASARYNDARAQVQDKLAQVKVDQQSLKSAVSIAELEIKKRLADNSLEQTAQAIRESEARILNMTDDNQRAQAQLVLNQQKQDFMEQQAAIENTYTEARIGLERGRLGVSQQTAGIYQQSVDQAMAPKTVTTTTDEMMAGVPGGPQLSEAGMEFYTSLPEGSPLKKSMEEQYGLGETGGFLGFGATPPQAVIGTQPTTKTTTTTREPVTNASGQVRVMRKSDGATGWKRPPIDTNVYEIIQ